MAKAGSERKWYGSGEWLGRSEGDVPGVGVVVVIVVIVVVVTGDCPLSGADGFGQGAEIAALGPVVDA